MSDGGYLIWRLYPEYSVMSDGRLEVYGAEKFMKLQDLSPEHFPLLDQEYHFGTILLHYSFVSANRIIEKLAFDPEWELTFIDDVAAVFVRIPEDGVALYPGLDLGAPDLFPPLRGEEDPYDMQRRLSRANFYVIYFSVLLVKNYNFSVKLKSLS